MATGKGEGLRTTITFAPTRAKFVRITQTDGARRRARVVDQEPARLRGAGEQREEVTGAALGRAVVPGGSAIHRKIPPCPIHSLSRCFPLSPRPPRRRGRFMPSGSAGTTSRSSPAIMQRRAASRTRWTRRPASSSRIPGRRRAWRVGRLGAGRHRPGDAGDRPIVTGGPLAAELGEAAGHVAGSLASVLTSAGLPHERAEALQREVAQGAVLLGVHVAPPDVERVRDSLSAAGAVRVEMVTWS